MNIEQFKGMVLPYTMTGEARVIALYNILEKVHLQNIEGDIVEVGVWRGGNIRGAVGFFKSMGETRRSFWLYDTFSGMTPPSDVDIDYCGATAESQMDKIKCLASIDDVKEVVLSVPHSGFSINFVEGDVRKVLLDSDTILPEKIAVLRLDTDFYDSTKIELEVLWPLVSAGGFLIVDDYGHWKGCKLACDEYFRFREHEKELMHEPIMADYTARIYRKAYKTA